MKFYNAETVQDFIGMVYEMLQERPVEFVYQAMLSHLFVLEMFERAHHGTEEEADDLASTTLGGANTVTYQTRHEAVKARDLAGRRAQAFRDAIKALAAEPTELGALITAERL